MDALLRLSGCPSSAPTMLWNRQGFEAAKPPVSGAPPNGRAGRVLVTCSKINRIHSVTSGSRALRAQNRRANTFFRLNSSYLDSLEQDPEREERKADLPRLAPWQSFRLEQAYQKGKKNYEVKSLMGDLHLSRSEVLTWLKLRSADPSLAPPKKDAPLSREKKAEPKTGIHNPYAKSGGARPVYRHWEVRYGDRRLNREAKDTLERVFSLNKYPTDEMISGIVDITKLPRRRIIQWFKDARKDDYQKSMNGSRMRHPDERGSDDGRSSYTGYDM